MESNGVKLPNLIDGAAYLMVRALLCVVQALPIEVCHSFCRGLAFLVNDCIPIRRAVVDENLHFAFPTLSPKERRRLSRGMWVHLLLMICEVAHAPRKIHPSNWRKHVQLENAQQLVGTLLDVRPRVLVSGHVGNFEMAGYLTGLLGFSTTTVARPLDNRSIHDFITKFRCSNNQKILDKEGCAPQIALLLERGEILSLLGDQYGGRKGCWIQFFGRPASCHKAVAVFSISTDAPLLVGYAVRRGKPMQFGLGVVDVFDPQKDPSRKTIPDVTQWYSDQLESLIRQVPDQYWWLHRRWKDPRRKKTKPGHRIDESTPPSPMRPQHEKNDEPVDSPL